MRLAEEEKKILQNSVDSPQLRSCGHVSTVESERVKQDVLASPPCPTRFLPPPLPPAGWRPTQGPLTQVWKIHKTRNAAHDWTTMGTSKVLATPTMRPSSALFPARHGGLMTLSTRTRSNVRHNEFYFQDSGNVRKRARGVLKIHGYCLS